MTGAPVPDGATAVVPVEATDGRTDVVTITVPSVEGRHIRRAGEDVAAGTTVLRAGQVVTPAVVGLAAALGLHALSVIPRQRVLVISTGSELVAPGAALRPGQIYESNSLMLAAAIREAGADVVAAVTASDDVAQFTAVLDRYAAESDLIITSGGVSAGAYEVVKDAFGRAGDQGVEFVKVAMQPGMPQGAGRVAGTPIVTVPGNPVSALVSFEVFIRPALRSAMGLPAAASAASIRGVDRDIDRAGRQTPVPSWHLRRRRRHRRKPWPAGLTPCALAGVVELPAGHSDRRDRDPGRRRRSQIWDID